MSIQHIAPLNGHLVTNSQHTFCLLKWI